MKNSAASSPGRRVWLHVRTRHVMFRVTSCRCLVVAVFFVFSFSFTVVTSAGCYRSNAKLLKPCKTIEDQPARSCENVRHKLSQNGQLRRLKKKNWKSCASSKQTKKKKNQESTLLALNQVLDNAWQRLDTQIDSISHEVSFVVNGSSPEHQEVQLHWGRTVRSSKK